MKFKDYQLVDGKYDLLGDGTCIYDIVYKDESKKNKLDLYLPSIKKKQYPLVIFIHGGGFLGSDKGRHLTGILNCLQDGYAVASVNYRLNDEAIYPAFVDDCVDAIRYLATHDKYPIDKNKIVLWGETHGGVIASTIGIKYHTLEEYKLAGVISFYAPIDLYAYHKYQIDTNQVMEVNGRIIDEQSFGKQGEELLELLKTYDVLSQIDGSQPPFYLLHGKKDTSVPIEYTYRFADILKEQNVSYVLDIVEDGTHGIDFYACEKYNTPIRLFIKKIFENDGE